MNNRQIIDAVGTEHGFDVAETTTRAWINDRYAAAVVAAKWRLAERQLAAALGGVTDYAITDPIINDIESVYLGALRYIPASFEEMQALLAGHASVDDADGAFTMAHDASGNQVLRVSPAPTVSSGNFLALVAEAPVDLGGDTDVPIIPTDLHKPICVDGAIAIGLERDSERLQEAAYFQASYDKGVAALERRRHRRMGRGPQTIRRGW